MVSLSTAFCILRNLEAKAISIWFSFCGRMVVERDVVVTWRMC